jgi:DNA-binding MarR family transcriptional regulator
MKPSVETGRDAVTELILEVFRLNGSLLAAGDGLVEDLRLTSARWQVLGAMALSPVPLPVAQLARNMGLSRQAVQRLANEMAADGLVRFAENPHHQRAKLVLLTARGQEAYDAAMARQGPWARKLGKGLSISKIEVATAVLRHMRQSLEDNSQSEARNALEKHA